MADGEYLPPGYFAPPPSMGHLAHEPFNSVNSAGILHPTRGMNFAQGWSRDIDDVDTAARVIDVAAREAAIRVLVVDDHDLFRTGLATYLAAQPDIEVVAQASGGRMGVRLADELRPEVVLMDLRMPDLPGPDAIRAILSRHPEMRVVVVTVASSPDAVTVALEAGARGFVAKDSQLPDVVGAVRAAVQGGAWLAPHAAEVVLGRLRRAELRDESDRATVEELSARELEVLRLVAQGMSNSQIAEALQISPRTAKNHVSSILSKLRLPSRVEAAVYAVRRGLR